MPSLGSLLGSFTGANQKKYADQAYQQSSAALQGGYDQGREQMERYNTQAKGYLQPYATQGGQANQRYGTYLGLNGADAQRSALAEYAGEDPFRQHNEDMATRAMSRRFNQMGMLDSGNSRLAMSRAMLDRGSQDYEAYLNRLAGIGQQGYGASSAMAGMDSSLGNNLGQMRMGLGQQQAGNSIQYANARSAADSILPNNLIKLGGIAASLYGGGLGGMAPVAQEATGKMGGINSLQGYLNGYGART